MKLNVQFDAEILRMKPASTPTPTPPPPPKEGEWEMASDVLIVNRSKLQQILSNGPEDKFVVVLTIPHFPNWIARMQKVFEELVSVTSGDVHTNKELSSVLDENQSKEVIDKLCELDYHVSNNQNTILTNPLFVVTPGENPSKEFRSCYSIYKGGKLWKDKLNRLPSPPTSLTVFQNKSNLSLRVDWKFENPGFPYSAIVFYRTTSDKCRCVSWERQKTTDLSKTTIYFEPGSAIEIAIAMDTCIGRSEFCAFETERLPFSFVDGPVKKQTIRKKHGPVAKGATAGPPHPMVQFVPPTCLQVENVTDCAAELLWLSSTDGDCQVNYWRHGKGSSVQSLTAAGSSIGCRLEKLQAGTTYSVNIAAVSDDGQGTSLPSQIVQFTTQKTKVARFAEKMAKRCEKVGSENGLDLYAVPLTKSLDGMAEIFSFGEVGQSKQQKTIMLVGVTDTAVKSRLINGMINYIFNVDWLDSFRFQLISEETDEAINVPVKKYHIHQTEGLKIPYSLTIIDTPDRISIEEQLIENPRFIPFHANGVDYYLNCGIFVTDVPHQPSRPFCLFDSIMTVYRNVEIVAASNVSDDNQLPLNGGHETGMRHKFDSSAFFCWNRKTEQELETDEIYAPRRHHFQSYYREYKLNRFMWFVAMKNFDCIFSF